MYRQLLVSHPTLDGVALKFALKFVPAALMTQMVWKNAKRSHSCKVKRYKATQ